MRARPPGAYRPGEEWMAKKPVGRPRGRNGESGDRGAAILDVSERLFARHGYDGVTLRTVAREAGVDLALINYYFCLLYTSPSPRDS